MKRSQVHFEEEGEARELSGMDDCRKCMLYRRQDCLGEQAICDMFRPFPDINQEDKDHWPKWGDATYIRLHPGKPRRD